MKLHKPGQENPILFRIGFDPGKHTGICVVDMQAGQVLEMQTTNHLNALLYLKHFWPACGHREGVPAYHGQVYLPGQLVICVENPSQNVTFPHNMKIVPSMTKAEIIELAKKRERISRNVGMNQGYAALFIEELHMRNHRVEEVVPGKSSLLGIVHDYYRPLHKQITAKLYQRLTEVQGRKVNAALFNEITGWSGPSSQHSRDAWLLVS